jgi:hypothetical protein
MLEALNHAEASFEEKVYKNLYLKIPGYQELYNQKKSMFEAAREWVRNQPVDKNK